MIICDRLGRATAGALRGVLSLLLALCLLFSAVPAAMGASSAGQYAASLTPSSVKTYIRLSKAVMFFTGETYGTGLTVTPAAGTVWQLVTDNYYTSPTDGREYYGVYYQSARYNVLRSDVSGDVMSPADLTAYITGTLWTASSFVTLRKSMNLVGDVRVHGVQYALSLLGYYTGALDGDYGEKTADAVKKFQRAKGLDADGSVGPLTQPILYSLASGGTITPGGSTGGSTGTTTTSGSLKTTASVNLRKSSSKSSARLAVVPKGVTLAYTNTAVKAGVTWYKVVYNSLDGWLMGTFVSAGGSSSGGSGSVGGAAIGTVAITKPSTRVRKTANGTKTGTVLAKGTVVDLLAQPTTAGGYTWYNIRTAAGLVGFVRGDCATASMGGSGVVSPSTDKTFIQLPAATTLFTTEARPASGGITVSAGTVVQMVSPVTYTSGGQTYCSVYYNNTKYNAVYDEVKGGIMSSDQLAAYVLSLWNGSLNSSLKQELKLVGDVRVYAMQVALSVLGYYTGALDGTFGGGSASAVRNFQRKAKVTVDGACGNETWTKLAAQAKAVSNGSTSGGGSSGGGGSGTVVTEFGAINSVEKASWTYDDNGATLFKKGTTATVLDVETGRVFTIYRWSGGSHADCVPYTAADTKTMCDIVNFPYNSKHPSSSQLAQIKKDDANNNANYTWPDFKNAWGGAKNIGSAWDRRPALLNVNGRVFCVSIYGYPHGFNGTDAFATAKFPSGSYFYAQNNFYGMMCLHFVGSKTHSGNAQDEKHQNAINTAYNYAKQKWPALVK